MGVTFKRGRIAFPRRVQRAIAPVRTLRRSDKVIITPLRTWQIGAVIVDALFEPTLKALFRFSRRRRDGDIAVAAAGVRRSKTYPGCINFDFPHR